VLARRFTDNPDETDRKFFEKLHDQLASSADSVKQLALGGVFQKFVSWIDRCHRRSLLGFPVPMDTIEWRTKRATAS
jgi:hypothetical protein